MADGFLGRWSRRKQEVREGLPLQEPVSGPTVRPELVEGHSSQSGNGLRQAQPERSDVSSASPAAMQPVEPPPPTLQDVRALTPQSDFKPFMAREVDPEVKNAAMKKLFADPHFNVMDGMDIYIDDYGKPDPLPASMLRQMVSAQFLNLFDEEKKGDNPAPPKRIDPPADVQPANPAAEAALAPAANSQLNTENHANIDLRLQQDHAAGAEGPGCGAE